MIHEKQVRQLCAIHTVNNLLQLPSNYHFDHEDIDESDYNDYYGTDGLHVSTEQPTAETFARGTSLTDPSNERDFTFHRWSCCELTLHEYKSKGKKIKLHSDHKIWCPATPREFDDIANEFTVRERALMMEEECPTIPQEKSSEKENEFKQTQEKSKKKNLTIMQRFRSQYGTPYIGNYSLEVIQMALMRRGVKMEFVREIDLSLVSVNNNEGSRLLLIGFVLYEKQPERQNILSFLRMMGSQVPIVKQFCGERNHWYAITRINYQKYQAQKIAQNDASCDLMSDITILNNTSDTPSWYLIDSNVDEIQNFNDEELVEFFTKFQERGGLIFSASIPISEVKA